MEVLVVFDRLAKAGKDEVKVALLLTTLLTPVKGRYGVADVRGWLHGLTADLAGAFDRRNGNSYYTRRLAQVPRL